MANLSDYSNQHAPLSWLQSSSGEWRYFIEQNSANKTSVSALEQDYIWLVSQASSTYKVGGYRIANDSIETLIKQLSGVNKVVVFGIPDEQKGNAVHVYVELTNENIDLTILSSEINAKLAGCLGEIACADVIKYVEQLPVAKNQKVARKILKSQIITMHCAA